MTEEERAGKRVVELLFYPHKRVEPGEIPLWTGGDMLLLPLYTGLGLPDICVQSLPSLKEEGGNAAGDSKGWRLAYYGDEERSSILTDRFSKDGIFDIGDMLKEPELAKVLLADTTCYKEILIEKELRKTNPKYVRAKKDVLLVVCLLMPEVNAYPAS